MMAHTLPAPIEESSRTSALFGVNDTSNASVFSLLICTLTNGEGRRLYLAETA